MNKKRIIIASIMIIFIVLVIVFLIFSKSEKIKITTNKGDVFINNLYKNPDNPPLSEQNDIVFRENENYSIYYYPEDQWFLITLLSRSFRENREKAENEFLKSLGINKKDACKLNTELRIPYSVSSSFSGKNYGLSFCPGSIIFDY